MFEGWCVQDGESYIKYESDALKCAKAAGYADLEEAYEDDFMYYTDWADIPEDEWDDVPAEAVINSLVDMTEGLLRSYVTEEKVKNRYQAIVNKYKQ